MCLFFFFFFSFYYVSNFYIKKKKKKLQMQLRGRSVKIKSSLWLIKNIYINEGLLMKLSVTVVCDALLI